MANDFVERVQAVYDCRDNFIGQIESRLHDLTGLKLTLGKTYIYPGSSANRDTIAINTGKRTVVSFETDKIAADLKTDDMYFVWRHILYHIGTDHVFLEPDMLYETKVFGKEAEHQLNQILYEIRRYDDDFGVLDVLGIFSATRHTIKIYAQVIAYYSVALKVPAEDLAFVVLTHELAHAYTIAGYDINGIRGLDRYLLQRWDREITEGLAQYYTDAISRQLEPTHPGFVIAFKKLRARQTVPYTWYQGWFENDQIRFDHNQNHEKLRSLMIYYRNTNDAAIFKQGL